MLLNILSTRTLATPGDFGGAITEAQGNGISDDGMAICGTGANPRPKVEARVARNVMEIDCADGVDNDGDELTYYDDTEHGLR